jgi:hypothetical protein
LFHLALGPIGLGLCGASDPGSQRLIDRLLEEGPRASFLARFLEARDLGWAAALVDQFPASPEGEQS